MLWRFLLAGVLGGLCYLDRTAACQLMLHRPLVAATLMGAIFGNLAAGAQVGAVLELIFLVHLPVGASMPPDDTGAAIFAGSAAAVASSSIGLDGGSFTALILLSVLFAELGAQEGDKRALSWMAYNLGKWVYLADAFDDLEKDAARGCYNVIWLQYGRKGDAADCRREMREAVGFNLKTSLSQCAAAYELLHIKRYKELLDNIVYLGLMDRTERVLKGESKQADESV